MSDKPKSLASARRRAEGQRREQDQLRKNRLGVLLATGNEILRVGLHSMIEQCGFRVFDFRTTDQGFEIDGLLIQKCRIFVVDGSEDSDFTRTKALVAQIREGNARGHIVVLIPPHRAHVIDPTLVRAASAIVTTAVTAYVLGILLQLVAQNYVIRSADVAIAPDPSPANILDVAVPILRTGPSSLVAAPLPLIGGRSFPGLSTRESETLLHVIRGSSNKVIARALGIAEATVKIHVKGIFRKIGVANRTQAAFHAFNHGWLDGEEVTRQDVELQPTRGTNCFPTGLEIIVPRTALG